MVYAQFLPKRYAKDVFFTEWGLMGELENGSP